MSDELGLPSHIFPVFGLTVGRPDQFDATAVKPRLPQGAVLHHEQYELQQQAAHVETYEQLLNDFYITVGLPSGWIDRVITRFGAVAGLKGREHLRAALQDRGFELR
ncbi:hypothetical protein [Kribbella sp. NPDC004875]|uniref:hypothetical protein n=1 Tax=Kribbella sp. NPDC004875 TaxID=3364107 RepID=UPI0036CAA905